jgi:DNA-binding transcriptional LysR family regulator
MTFQQLTYIVEISKCGSINKAAQKLYLSQTGISSAIRTLEEELGVQLLTRTNRGVEFTPAGKEFVSYAVSLLEQKARIEELYKNDKNIGTYVALSVSSQRFGFVQETLLKIFTEIQEPRFYFSYREKNMNAVIDDVYDHRADIGMIFQTEFTEKFINHLLELRNLEFHELLAMPPCVFCRKDHPLTKLETVTEESLLNYPYIYYEQQLGTAAEFSEEYQLISLRKPSRSLCINDRTTANEFLAKTDAFTIGSGLLSQDRPDVVSIPLENKSSMRLGWIAPKNEKLSPLAERFVSTMRESVEADRQYTQSVHRCYGRI